MTFDPRFNADRIVFLNMGLGRDSITELCLLFEGYLEVGGRWLTPKDIDAVVFSDLGYEWPQTYALIPRLKELCAEHGVRFIILRKPVADENGSWHNRHWMGEEWASIEEKAAAGGYHLRAPILDDYMSRNTVVSLGKGDCTENHKILPIRRLLNDICVERFGMTGRQWGTLVRKGERLPHLNLIGFAADEASRAEDGKTRSPSYVTEAYPLIEMGLSKSDEQEVLDAWGFGHVLKSGCWMCPYQSPAHYWVVRETMPEQWAQLLGYEATALERNPKMFVTGRKPIAEAVNYWRAKHPTATVEAILTRGYSRGCLQVSTEGRRSVATENPSAATGAEREATGSSLERPPLLDSNHPAEVVPELDLADDLVVEAVEDVESLEVELEVELEADSDEAPVTRPGSSAAAPLSTSALTECICCGTDWVYGDFLIYGCDVYTDDDGDRWLTHSGCCEEQQGAVEAYGFTEAYGVSVEYVARLITGEDVVAITEPGDSTVVCRLVLENPTRVTDKRDVHGNHKAASKSGWQGELFGHVDLHHRHHDRPQGWKFGLAVANGRIRVGAAIVGRPTSQELQKSQPHTLEVTRVVTWGKGPLRHNASSKLYAAACKQARALGYDRMITYTLDSESGHSLESSGWTATHQTTGGSWDRPSRPRTDKAPTSVKVRWEKGLTKKTKRLVKEAGIGHSRP